MLPSSLKKKCGCRATFSPEKIMADAHNSRLGKELGEQHSEGSQGQNDRGFCISKSHAYPVHSGTNGSFCSFSPCDGGCLREQKKNAIGPDSPQNQIAPLSAHSTGVSGASGESPRGSNEVQGGGMRRMRSILARSTPLPASDRANCTWLEMISHF